ncbi:MAG: hypothetical protein ACP5NW_00485, partial [Candidatus Woesearchaeota archaeon]
KEVARITKKDGLFIFSMNHPFSESYEKKTIDGKQVLVMKPYFNNDKFEWSMNIEGMKMINYHHTFEDIITSLSDCGFVVEKLIEARPTKEFKKYNKNAYDRTFNYPSFIAIKARKIK